jgi:hypothetical protein
MCVHISLIIISVLQLSCCVVNEKLQPNEQSTSFETSQPFDALRVNITCGAELNSDGGY